ncbi:glycosyltransferase, partial [Klebsiella pneumoniae]|uniref:glycosyltransferase n=1 Tax=Klebsiella pneumoniae TaxID=573 RepID=UPI001BE09609
TPFFEEASLCLHLSNGDAFPVSTLEAMSAGVPTIVSTTTGTKEVVKVIEPRLVVDSEPMAAIKAVDWYFGLSEGAKVGISD